ncbi:MAG TPA: hypothetical protein VND91_06625 [Candidatus Saccharimonadia bacterium]|nr:hypothetical protein [Candidatus Saccharimonadia bacterium]
MPPAAFCSLDCWLHRLAGTRVRPGSRVLILRRVLGVALYILSASQAAAFQCQPLSLKMAEAPIVFIGRTQEIVRLRAVTEDEGPRIAGTPESYDLIRIHVVEQLKGELPASFEILCPAGDPRCRPASHRWLVVALVAPPTGTVPQRLVCNLEYLNPPQGWELADEGAKVRRLIREFRGARKAQ